MHIKMERSGASKGEQKIARKMLRVINEEGGEIRGGTKRDGEVGPRDYLILDRS
jgi:hypothetical protein